MAKIINFQRYIIKKAENDFNFFVEYILSKKVVKLSWHKENLLDILRGKK